MKHFIEINGKKYEYTISPLYNSELGENVSLFICESVNIHQEFENADIPNLLEDLGNLILSEQDYRIKNTEVIRFRLTKSEKEKIQENANKHGYKSTSKFLKDLALTQ